MVPFGRMINLRFLPEFVTEALGRCSQLDRARGGNVVERGD